MRYPDGVEGSVDIGPVVGQLALVVARHERRRDHEVGRRPIAAHGDVPDDGESKERLHVRIVWLWLERIPEEHQEVDLAVGDECAKLLIAAKRSAAELLHWDVELFLEERSGRSGGDEIVGRKEPQVEPGPGNEVWLLVVVCDEPDPLSSAEFSFHASTSMQGACRSTPRRLPSTCLVPRWSSAMAGEETTILQDGQPPRPTLTARRSRRRLRGTKARSLRQSALASRALAARRRLGRKRLRDRRSGQSRS